MRIDYVLEGDRIVYQKYSTGEEIWYNYDAAGKLLGFHRRTAEELTGNYYYIRNGQGDILGFHNQSGRVVVRYTYDAWGKVISISGSMANTLGQMNPFRYRGYYYDEETELYYLNSRYYSPEWGRFVNGDAVTAGNYGIGMHNMFSYCSNNPINRSDSSGFTSYMQDKGVTFFPTGFTNVSEGIKKKSYTYTDKGNGKTKTRDVYIVAKEKFDTFKAPKDSIVVVDMRNNDNPNMQIRDSWKYIDREEQIKVVQILLTYDEWYPSANEWTRSQESMLIEWDAHNGAYYYSSGILSQLSTKFKKANQRAAHVDLDNRAEGKTYGTIILDAALNR